MQPDSLVEGTSLDLPEQVSFFGAIAHEIEVYKKKARSSAEESWSQFRALARHETVRLP